MDIARELDAIVPDPPLFPAEAAERARVEEAERWGDREFQPVPRRILRWGMTKDAGLRRWLAETDRHLPLPAIAGRVMAPVSLYYARVASADEKHVRRDIAELPRLLDHIDELMAEGVIGGDPPNAATLQIMCTVRSLLGFCDFEEQLGARAFAPLARELFPRFPEEKVPPFVERLGVA